MLAMPGFSYSDAVAFVATPLNGVLLLLLTITMAYHSTLGVQVVIEDYVHSHGLKLAALIIIRFAHVLFAAAAIYGIFKIGLSA